MLAAITNGQGKIVGLHRTYLHDGNKAPVDQPKKTLGTLTEDCAIRLFAVSDRLGVAEGIENGIAASAYHRVRCWSLVSAGHMEKFVWPANLRELHVFGDRDSSFTGQKAAYTLAYRARGKGIKVFVDMPREFDIDWADIVKTLATAKAA
jgi:putative DNA primase/helicase